MKTTAIISGLQSLSLSSEHEGQLITSPNAVFCIAFTQKFPWGSEMVKEKLALRLVKDSSFATWSENLSFNRIKSESRWDLCCFCN